MTANEVNGEVAAREVIGRAEALFREGDREGSLALLRAAWLEDPSDPALTRALANLRLARREPAEALGLLEELCARFPREGQLANSLGIALCMANRQGEALPHLRRAVELLPGDPALAANLGKVLLLAGLHQEARPHLERAAAAPGAERDPGLGKALARCRELAGQEERLGRELARLGEAPVFPAPDLAPGEAASLRTACAPADLADLAGRTILHAPMEIAGNMARLARHLRGVGLQALAANYFDSWLEYRCDFNLPLNRVAPALAERTRREFFAWALPRFDFFHFHFGQSLLPGFGDLARLREAGKRILFSYWGSDMRSPEWILYQQARFLGHHPPRPYPFTRQQYQAQDLINQYADVVLAPVVVPRGLWLPAVEDPARWDPAEKARLRAESGFRRDPGKVYFVHAPTDNWKKGSRLILGLFEQCRAAGLPVEMIYVHGLPPAKARLLYANADYAIDQVGVGTFGLFGQEMLAFEVPLLCYHSECWDRLRDHPPVVKITRESFRERIEACVAWHASGEREALAARGRAWMEEHHRRHRQGIPALVAIYAALARGELVRQCVNLSWYEHGRRLAQGVKSGFHRYLRENGVYAELGMAPPEYDRALYE